MARQSAISRLLVADVGNTNICLGVFQGNRLLKTLRLPSRPGQNADFWHRTMVKALPARWLAEPWVGGIVASVVPGVNRGLVSAMRQVVHGRVILVKSDMPLPIRNAYQPPRKVGADRLINAMAAVDEFNTPVLIVDFGTAITVDAVGRGGIYLGGVILPGLNLSLDSLARGTALLPKTTLGKTRGTIIGRNTQQSIRHGVIYGAAGAVEKIIAGMRREIGRQAKVVATGGQVSWLGPICASLDYIRPDLTLQGLRLTWIYLQRRCKSSSEYPRQG